MSDKQQRKILDIRGNYLSNAMKECIKAQGKTKITVKTARKIWQAEQPFCSPLDGAPFWLVRLVTGIKRGSKVRFVPNAKLIGKSPDKVFAVEDIRKGANCIRRIHVKLKEDQSWYNIAWLTPAGRATVSVGKVEGEQDAKSRKE